ncbi:hypothetical protein MX803_003211 [Escherichia coli]|nr:hypothetical protein [Escherichia coli]EJC1790343.1 hypothetical protein [Escherichia coli]
MREEAQEVEVPKKAHDPLANVTAQRWNAAVQWRAREQIGGKSLRTVLRECYEQREGILSSEDAEIADELGIDIYVNISALKVSALTSWLRDLLLNTPELPFVISPTPIPDLSEKARMEVLNKVKMELYAAGGFQGDLLSLIRSVKFQQLEKERQYAEVACNNMSRLIKDQCMEGGFQEAFLKTITDFATYPFAVFHGPVPTMVTQMEWSGSSLTPKDKIQFQFRPISVFDFYWSPDSRNAQEGTGIFIREQVTKQDLYKCLGMKSYIKANVQKVLEATISKTQNLKWMSRNPEQPDTIGSGWGNGETLDVLRHYGMFSGKELKKYGITGIDDDQFYDACISMVGQYTIQAFILPNPHVGIRPVYTASFETAADRIPGFSICQKLRDVERAYMNTLRFLMTNEGLSAGPFGEVDYSRIQRYMNPEDIGRITALTLHPVDPDMSAGGHPAYKLQHIPSNMGAYLNCAQFFMDLADRVTQIPAAIHGEPVGTGANRTFRGMAMLYGNAIKPIQSAVGNMDVGIFRPLGTLMYNYNMQYSDDESVKGDAKIIAQGATGLISKEVAKQNAFDTLQLVATMGSAAQGAINPGIMKWAVENALKASGVPVDELEAIPAAPPVMPQQGVPGPQQQGGGEMMPQSGTAEGA